MDHLERVKLPGQAWNTMEESGSGGSRSVSLSDTLATLAQISDPFDTRGVEALTLWTDLIAYNTGAGDSVNVFVFTRKLGLPFMPVIASETSLGLQQFSLATIWPGNGVTGGGSFIPTIWTDTWVGVHDESVVVVQPNVGGSGTEAFVADGAGNVTYRLQSDLKGNFGDAFSVALIDPGVPDSPLSISSVDGFVFTISLETDNMGAIVTNGNDIANMLRGTPGNIATNWAITCDVPNAGTDPVAAEVLPLAGGDAPGVVGVTYTVSGTY